MIDTHCHLNSFHFQDNFDEVIKRAFDEGITHIVVPGTSVEMSKKAVEIASKYENIYAAVGIHPHHVFDYQIKNEEGKLEKELKQIEDLISDKKVVAIGEIGIDRYYYRKTKYSNYQVTKEFIDVQKEVLKKQIDLAKKYKKSLILHNREAVPDFLQVVSDNWSDQLKEKTVFHCCEPDMELLKFAKEHRIFIGVDGDITYFQEKQGFIKKIPLELLVLETDSPFLIPEPLRSQKIFPNEPKNIKVITEFISRLLGRSIEEVIKTTTSKAKRLFEL